MVGSSHLPATKYDKSENGNGRDSGAGLTFSSDWANLPEGLVAQIGDILLAQDLLPYISLRGVCRHWRQTTDYPVNTNRRFRPHNWILINPVTNLCQSDCALAKPLLYSQTRCHFLNFLTGNRIRVDIPALHNHCIRACVDGLLLVTQIAIVDTPARLLNPFTGAMTDYPALYQLCCLHSKLRWWPLMPLSIRFASSTTSTLVVLTRSDVAFAVSGSTEWKLIPNRNPLAAVHMAHAYFESYTYVFSVAKSGSVSELRLT
ncbi:uncharacterized protein LOC144556898 [Carex rostrata]